jgi:hypothetical protein
MEALFDRLGLYDFFNVITAGGIILFYCLASIFYLNGEIFTGLKEGWILNVGLFLIAYVLGMICQEIGVSLTECRKGVRHVQIEMFLNIGNRVIDNDSKVEAYRGCANKFLNLNITGNDKFDYEKSKRFFSHCIYYIENKGKNQKVEKMRALMGMAQNLIGVALLIPICGAGVCLVCKELPDAPFIICSGLFLGVVLCLGIKRVVLYHKQMIRMTMGVYEACMNEGER